LGAADAAVLSIEDLLGDWTLAEYLAQHVPLLVVTLGRQGGVLFNHGQRLRFPALRVVEVDPTGAGDIFATVFFDALASGIQPGNAAHFAACLASRSVTRSGLLGVPDADDIAACRIL
jgi:sugar/nucleoside kinase (ribokinase family)